MFTVNELKTIERMIRGKVGPPNGDDELILRLIGEIRTLWEDFEKWENSS